MRNHFGAVTNVLVVLLSASSVRADAKDDAVAAAKKLLESDNYSWTTKSEGGAGQAGGSTGADGKAQHDGLIMLNLKLRDATAQVFLQGDKGAFKTDDDGWKSLSEASDDRGPERRIANLAKNYRPPAAQARRFAERVQDLKKTDDGALTGTLPGDVAKTLVERRIARAGGAGGGVGGASAMEIKDANATVKFWIDEGMLWKFESHITGVMSVAGQEREFERTTTVEFKDVGTTKIEVPEEAKAKMG